MQQRFLNEMAHDMLTVILNEEEIKRHVNECPACGLMPGFLCDDMKAFYQQTREIRKNILSRFCDEPLEDQVRMLKEINTNV
jgi:hypothetical protein